MSTNKRRVLIIDPKVKSYKCIDFELTSLMPISLLLTNYLATNDDIDTVVKRDFIVIGTGVLGGHAGVGLAVSTLTGISPQSNRVIEAKIEGKLAASIRSLGLDALAIDGCSDSMIGLKISSQNNQLVVKFEDAELLRGKSVWQTTKSLEKDNQTVLAIGKAGEEKVPCPLYFLKLRLVCLFIELILRLPIPWLVPLLFLTRSSFVSLTAFAIC